MLGYAWIFDPLSIEEQIDRLETIAQTLEAGDIALATATDLREEADDHLRGLREDLDVGDGDIIEVRADAPASGPEARRPAGQVNRSGNTDVEG